MELSEQLQEHKQTLVAAIEQEDRELLDQWLPELRAADLSEILEEMAEDDGDLPTVLKVLDCLPLERRANVLGYLTGEVQVEVAEAMSDEVLLSVLEEMGSDERADLFNLLGEDRQEVLLRRMARQEREDLKRLASYEEGTAGSIMTSDYVAIPSGMTVSKAMMRVRQTAPDAETVYQLYIIDQDGKLAGTLSLRQLMVARPGAQVDDLMIKDVISVSVDEAQEEVARLVARYDMLAVPVIDHDERLVGIVTHDDAMDVAEEEATEDFHKGMSIGQLEDGVSRVPIWSLYRKRVTWLVLLVFANLFSGAGIAYFEDTIAAQVALVFFLPLLIGSGGNAGAQAATLMVRGMATGDVGVKDWSKLLGRELLVAGSLGLTMALAVAPIGVLRGGEAVAIVVAMSMVTIVLFGSLLGMCLPFVLNRVGWDPATASAPLVTTLIDACGVVIYFTIATAILTGL
ncbi:MULTISPECIES: magnesium transporter [Billgrantia]|uniref:Magnesium transporter MgtE n=2 Tax=Billgrantia TaxID=3137761 RepID=A0ABS9A819_9GAMM|nr:MULTISPECIES: magnesium transporter [Halomonas]MCE8004836.1 magnesium transporter [Halomonas ethanolica]MCE8010228.1 magnesium transporter [Halomonas desiderata]MCE8029878.1 magnesium transporter [Halomonas desiderata]MCE8044609.1 magnesium transporter [Halomonas desiderata]MCE8049108.1 magnesium transporter [Halomonas desiderata]